MLRKGWLFLYWRDGYMNFWLVNSCAHIVVVLKDVGSEVERALKRLLTEAFVVAAMMGLLMLYWESVLRFRWITWCLLKNACCSH